MEHKVAETHELGGWCWGRGTWAAKVLEAIEYDDKRRVRWLGTQAPMPLGRLFLFSEPRFPSLCNGALA